jgi:muramidase (phage lysozyme)
VNGRLLLAAALAAIGAALFYAARANAASQEEGAPADDGFSWDALQLPTFPDLPDPFAPFMDAIGQPMDPAAQDRNLAAFLQAIRAAEGTAGPNGYRTLFGGSLFDSFADHPRQAKRFTDKAGRSLWTSAAGAYQFMAVSPIPGGGSTRVDTWDRIKARLQLVDFSPASQDAAAIELIREAGALDDVMEGRFDRAVNKVRRIWASLPGAGYAQGERSVEFVRNAYTNAGGAYAQV